MFSLGDASHSFIEFALRDGAAETIAVSTVAGVHGPRQTIEGVNFVVAYLSRLEHFRYRVTQRPEPEREHHLHTIETLPLKINSMGRGFVVGFRPELWRAVTPADAPADAASFKSNLIGPDGYTMPATQSDIFV